MTYKAPRWVLWVVGGAFVTFCIVALAAILHPDIPRYGVWVSSAGVLLGLGGIIEVLVGRVVLERDSIVIRQWYRTERVPLADVVGVSLEGGRTALRLRTGTWKRLPEWLGANQSLGRRIRDRLKSQAGA
jgi:hypothetical protein